MNCDCHLASCGPVVARWKTQTGYWFPLCQTCLDHWFDNADDDDDLEPAAWTWLTGVTA
jgi:hypothetical protein